MRSTDAVVRRRPSSTPSQVEDLTQIAQLLIGNDLEDRRSSRSSRHTQRSYSQQGDYFSTSRSSGSFDPPVADEFLSMLPYTSALSQGNASYYKPLYRNAREEIIGSLTNPNLEETVEAVRSLML